MGMGKPMGRKRKLRIVAGVLLVIALLGAISRPGDPAPQSILMFWASIALFVIAWIIDDDRQDAGT